MNRQHIYLVIPLLTLGFFGSSPLRAAEKTPTKATRKIDFARDIRPILTENCFRCHGPDEKSRRADLRLDVRKLALAELDSGERAIVPGKPKNSEVIFRINTTNRGLVMPPRATKKTLTTEQKELLQQWIEQGAEYTQHWAFVAPYRPALPTVKDRTWGRNPIDAFILRRLEAQGLTPAEEADRASLIRRVALDLTGIPPTPTEVDAFVQDRSPNAYEKVVDRLLASTAYGERWGRLWLDLARYADSAGYAQDPPRTIWRYRDWVIEAINANKPFDVFTIEQLAGDLLPEPTPDQLIATAFHRNTMTNSEGGTNDEEFRSAAVVDRVNTTMQVWMGMTMGCAQCHSHKYDPISQKEFYRFYAILNNTADADRGNESPTLVQLTPEQQERKDQLGAEIARIQKELAAPTPGSSTKGPSTPRKGLLKTRHVRVQLLGKGVYLHLAEVQVFAGKKNLALAGKARQSSTDFGGTAQRGIDGNTKGDYFQDRSTTHTGRENDPWWEVDLGSAQHIDRIVVWNRTDGGTEARLTPFRVIALDEKRQPLWVDRLTQAPKPSVELKIPTKFEEISAETRRELARLRGIKGPNSPLKRRLQQLRKQWAAIKGVPTPIMRELPPGKRRKTFIHVRGNFLVKGDQVAPGVPAAFNPLPKAKVAGMGGPENPNRLDLARWLVARDNPLTARVTVNRFWEELFGIGLVETSEDFGVQGEPPSHPELLDWLSVELMEQGWDTKRLVRLLVTSATYRQSSRVTPEKLDTDPRNRLLSRGPRFRLSAEAIRDQALAVSGLLSRKMYGPSVRPPRPKLGLRAAFGGSTDWVTSSGQDRYRRGLYTRWRRTTPYPSMTTFDAPSREVCTIRRVRTNTPLQALVTLNDPVYIEAAQALARRVIREAGREIPERIRHMFRLCLSREPSKREGARLQALYQQALARYQKDPTQAKQLASEPLGPIPTGMDSAELASWTLLANVLMNLDEFLARR